MTRPAASAPGCSLYYSAVLIRLRDLRIERKLTQRDLGQQCGKGMGPKQISACEAGYRTLKVEGLLRVCAVLDVDPAAFFEDVKSVARELKGLAQ